MSDAPDVDLLGAGEVRELAARLGIRPTKQWGQNFVVDGNTVRRIVRVSGVGAEDVVVEVGPGLGSLTLALLPVVRRVVAVEVDPALAAALPDTVRSHAPALADRLEVVPADALTVTALPGPAPTALVANLPYNVSVPVVLRYLERFPSVGPGARHGPARGRGAAGGAPRLAHLRRAQRQGGVVRRRPPRGTGAARGSSGRCPTSTPAWSSWSAASRRPGPATREEVFRVVDAAFAQRRKTLRAALAGWAGSPAAAEAALRAAGVDPRTRGEQLDVAAFARIAAAGAASGPD